MTIDDYILAHIDPEPTYLQELYHEASVRFVHAHQMSGHLQGRLLATLTRMVQPRYVLEIGTFVGYSALCLAEGLPHDGEIYTYEVNDEIESFTRQQISRSPYAEKIHFIIGDALELAPMLNLSFDLIFIDGFKTTYIQCYEMALTLLSNTGFILVDNTLWDEHILDPAYDHHKQTIAIRQFNDYVAQDQRVSTVILPLRDGLTIITRRR